mmetsp:Transcript_68306/g.160738  ORF Transcript_68306/g.160738 Transcript_68306/m.160738 type:complete len:212 (-) Transcript_68306:12-647(-)
MRMAVGDALQNLYCYPRQLVFRHPRAIGVVGVRNVLAQGSTTTELHDKVYVIRIFKSLVISDCVRMIGQLEERHFELERLFVSQLVLADCLDGHGLTCSTVVRLVNLSKPTFTNFLAKFIQIVDRFLCQNGVSHALISAPRNERAPGKPSRFWSGKVAQGCAIMAMFDLSQCRMPPGMQHRPFNHACIATGEATPMPQSFESHGHARAAEV